jgi:hypothetical protein
LAVNVRTAALLLLCVQCTVAQGAPNIFDDDWAPPKPASIKPAPPTPTTAPATPRATITPPRPAGQGDSTPPPPPLPKAPSMPKEGVPAAAGTRHAVPEKDALAKSRRLMREIFAKELADRSVAGRQALAKRLLTEARKSSDVPADQYTLLGGALDAATEGANLKLCFDVADQAGQVFELSPSALKLDAIDRMGVTKRGSGVLAVADVPAVLDLVHQLNADGNYAAALRAVNTLRTLAADVPARNALEPAAKEVAELKATQDRLAVFVEKLKTAPDDPAANLAVGSHYCFRKREWERGLPALSKGSDPGLAAAARADVSKPVVVDAQVKLADAWFSAAARVPKEYGPGVKERAELWYSRALPRAAGLQRLAIQKRLRELPGTTDFELLAALVDAGLDKSKRSGGKDPAGAVARPATAGLLVGLEYTTLGFVTPGRRIIKSLAPVFLTKEGSVKGKTYGVPSKSMEPKTLEARPGYAVGGLVTDGTDRLNGFKVVFMRVHGVTLDPEDSYESEWIGGTHLATTLDTLGGDGRPVVGLQVTSGMDIDALGLLQTK